MMKCIKWNGLRHNDQIERVTDEVAFDLVEVQKVAVYVPRHVWKEQVRDGA